MLKAVLDAKWGKSLRDIAALVFDLAGILVQNVEVDNDLVLLDAGPEKSVIVQVVKIVDLCHSELALMAGPDIEVDAQASEVALKKALGKAEKC